MRTALLALVAASALLAAPSDAPAAIVFDNLAGSGGTPNGTTFQIAPNQGLGAILNFASSVRITSFEVYTAIVNPQQGVFQFVIADAQTNQTLLTTAFRTFPADSASAPSFKSSGSLDFTFQSGRSYAVGYVSNFGSTTPTLMGPYSQNGISTTGNAAIFTAPQFANPAITGSFVGNVAVRLNGDLPPPVGAIPEPSSLLLVGLAGSIGVFYARARR